MQDEPALGTPLSALLDRVPAIRTGRRNHALEHATVTLLARRVPRLRLVGHATPHGFRLIGNLETETVANAAADALDLLQSGQAHLAVHPRCGTNLAVATLLAWLTPLVAGRGSRPGRLIRASLFLALVGLAAPSLGLLVQKHVTTSPDQAGRQIATVCRREIGPLVIHEVEVIPGAY